jgi:maleylacetate reductase
MLPTVMRWNRIANADRQAMVAATMGRPGEDAGDLLDACIGGLGMPHSLSAVNVGAENFDRTAEQAMATVWVSRDPRRIDGPAQVEKYFSLQFEDVIGPLPGWKAT